MNQSEQNPFNPSVGSKPPMLVGRDFRLALQNAPGMPDLISLVSGTRGSGKTALLTAVEEIVREEGWLVISETASPGFNSRILSTSEYLISLIDEGGPVIRLSGLT